MTFTFDEQTFKRRWRDLCAQTGIDPVEGATAYQVANLKAERRKAEPRSCWWASDSTLWEESPPYHSTVEEAALYQVFSDARDLIYKQNKEGKRRCVRPRVRHRSWERGGR